MWSDSRPFQTWCGSLSGPPGACRGDSPSRMGALRSLTTPTFFSLVPLQMSDSSAPLPLASEPLSLGGVVLACEGHDQNVWVFLLNTEAGAPLHKKYHHTIEMWLHPNGHSPHWRWGEVEVLGEGAEGEELASWPGVGNVLSGPGTGELTVSTPGKETNVNEQSGKPWKVRNQNHNQV